jgi:hypothetical protein
VDKLSVDVFPWMQSQNGILVVEDKASWHISKYTKEEVAIYNIPTYTLKGYWKDLNWMEKVWSNLKDKVYVNGKKYQTKAELVTAIRAEWEVLMSDCDYRRRLIVAFEQACRDVIENRGYYV